MDEFRKHEVYVKVPIAKCWGKTGKKPIGVRWVDNNKGDQEEACIVKVNDDDDDNNNNNNKEGLYTAMFLACIALMTTVPSFLSKIWIFLKRCLGDDKNNEVMPDTMPDTSLAQPPTGAP